MESKSLPRQMIFINQEFKLDGSLFQLEPDYLE